MAESKGDKIEGFVQDELPGLGEEWHVQKVPSQNASVNEGPVKISQIPSGNTAQVIKPAAEDLLDEGFIAYNKDGKPVYHPEKSYHQQIRDSKKR